MLKPARVILAVIGGMVLSMLLAFWMLASGAEQGDEQIRVNWVDTLWHSDSARGEGIEIVFAADRKHPEGMRAFQPVLAQLCAQFAATAIAHVENQLDKRDPAYVVITIGVGRANFGVRVREYFRFDGKVCHPYV